ncbi:MAG: 2-C-methyl-D-erythritol 2,4-cyclodiphosphate synthase [Arsenophonus sp.]|nr:MAG: 2-C-methyl-D-erythritol 2,4-cyclodiphosphate synthase [Arsenophonus sp.]
MRIGYGFDIHKFGKNGILKICGVKIPYQKSLIAYSDGDVALHALTDAILGAAALGDIGKLFPDTNPNFKGISSRILLREAYSKVLRKGYCIGNLDITIIAEKPKMFPYIFDMRKNIAEDLNCDIDSVSVKATSTEKLKLVGEEEGIICEAIVLLIKDNSNYNDKNLVTAW